MPKTQKFDLAWQVSGNTQSKAVLRAQSDSEALVHSRSLSQLIRTKIKAAGGSIGFDEYMQLALYEPGMGYYSAGAAKFGASGDFVTAPQISALFSQALARQCAAVLGAIQKANILEFGAGTGVMAADLLLALEKLHALPDRYYILELSAELRQRQQHMLQTRLAHLYERVVWLEGLPKFSFRGIVLANEVFDAMPVRCFKQGEDELWERRVGVDSKGGFRWIEQPGDSLLKSEVDTIKHQLIEPLPPGYCSEVNLQLGAWINAIKSILEQAIILIIDYGYPRREYYHPQRCRGTLLCHYRHRAHEDPFFYPGLQDISANVDFSAVAEAAYAGGLSVLGYTTQAYFLLANGLGEIFDELTDERLRLHYSQQIKRLTLPSEMGERFQVIALGQAFDRPLCGFMLRDFRYRL
jgi:SAM-dependent MidA family methyltransferase